MRNAQKSLLLIILVVFGTGIIGGLYWANIQFVHNVTGGTEFIVPNRAMKNFIMEGITPYGELTLLNIQNEIYGHSVSIGQYPYRVNIPLFMLLFYLPLSWVGDVFVARAIWLILLEFSIFGLVLVCLRLARWKPHWALLFIILLYFVLWLPSIMMLVTATSILLQALLFCVALRSIELGSDELAGGLIALTLLNVEATGLVFLVIVAWVLSTQRWRVLGGIGMMLALLFSLSLILLPSWILPFLGSTITNWRAGLAPSTYNLFESWMPGIGHRLAQILAVGALATIFVEMRAVRGQDVRWLFWTLCLTAAVTPMLGVPYSPAWVVFTMPGLLLVISVMNLRWKLFGLVGSLIVLMCVFLGLWTAALNGIVSAFILFYPIFLTLLLYWVRWGSVRQPRLWADEIALRG